MGTVTCAHNGNLAPAGLPIPEGLIVPSSAAAPAGWTDFSSADGKFIVGAGSTYSFGDTGGSTSVGLSMSTSTGGSHSGGTVFATSDFGSSISERHGNTAAGSHSHSISATASAEDVYKNFRLIKANAGQTELPADAFLLGHSDLSGVGLTQQESATDRFLKANSTYGGTGGSASSSVGYITNSTGAHGHGSITDQIDVDAKGGNVYPYLTAGAHSHSGTLSATLNTKHFYLTAWNGAAVAFNLVEGGIAMIESATAPDGWALCDGTGGTPDLRDFFIRIGSLAQQGTSGGNNSCTYSTSTSSSGSHNHRGTLYLGSPINNAYHSNNLNAHTHSASQAKSVVPPYYALSFIKKAA